MFSHPIHPSLAAAFITPALAVAGLALAAVPIIIHLLNRRRFKTVEFAAMRFVLEAMKRNRRRLRFESWMLLAMRCLLVGLIGVGLARPLGCDNAFAGVAGRDRMLHLFILDNSGSTAATDGESTVLARTREAAVATLDVASRSDARAAAFASAAPASDLVGEPTFDLASAAEILMSTPGTSASNDLLGAVNRATDAAGLSEPGERVVVHLLSDAAFATLDQPRLQAAVEELREVADEIRVYRPDADAPLNAAVLRVAPEQSLVRSGFDVPIVATASGYNGRPDVNAVWSVAGNVIDSQPAELEAGTVELAAGPQVLDALEDGVARVVSLRLSGSEDALTVDDERRAVIERVAALPTLVVEGGLSSTGPLARRSLLSTALSPGGTGYVEVRQITGLELPDTPLESYRAIVLNDVGGIDEATAARLETFVRSGGTLLLWLGPDVTVGNYAATLLPRGLLPGTLARQVAADVGSDELGLVAFDFDPGDVHPLLSAFAGVDQSGLAAPLFRRYWLIEPKDDADVALRFSGTGDPAIVTHRLDAGQVVTVASSGSDPAWTLLPLLDNYAAFVHELLRNAVGTSGGGSSWQNLVVGDLLVIPASVKLPPGTTPQLVGGSTAVGLTRRLDAGPPAWVSPPLEEVGSFEVAAGDVRMPVVVNFPPGESDLTRTDDATLRTIFGEDVALLDLSATTPASLAASEDGPDWGWTLLVLAMLVACGEAAFAAVLGRRRG